MSSASTVDSSAKPLPPPEDGLGAARNLRMKVLSLAAALLLHACGKAPHHGPPPTVGHDDKLELRSLTLGRAIADQWVVEQRLAPGIQRPIFAWVLATELSWRRPTISADQEERLSSVFVSKSPASWRSWS